MPVGAVVSLGGVTPLWGVGDAIGDILTAQLGVSGSTSMQALLTPDALPPVGLACSLHKLSVSVASR